MYESRRAETPLASSLNVPLATGDATSLIEVRTWRACSSSCSRQPRATGIVYIDEVDKLREGSVSSTPKARSPRCRHRAEQPGIPFDTSNILFICGGAFVGLEDITARRLGRGGFGFQLAENSQVAGDGLLRCVLGSG